MFWKALSCVLEPRDIPDAFPNPSQQLVTLSSALILIDHGEGLGVYLLLLCLLILWKSKVCVCVYVVW